MKVQVLSSAFLIKIITIPEGLRWRDWATDSEGITGDGLLDFVDTALFKTLKELRTTATDARGQMIGKVFEDAYNYMKNGTLIRQVINKLNEVDFNKKDQKKQFSEIYEKILKDLQSAGNVGEYYTPRAVTKFIVDRIKPQLGEIVFDPACGTGGFLTAAIDYIRQHFQSADVPEILQRTIRGTEKKPLLFNLCVTNLDISFLLYLPKKWALIRLGDLVKKLGAGSTPLGGKNVYVDDGIRFLRSQNVWNDGLKLDEVAYITSEIHQKMSGTVVEAGDILLNITGASIGRCAVVPDNFDEGNVSQHVSIIRLINKDLRHYLHLCLISSLIQNQIMEVQVGISREGLSMNSLKDFLIPVPPLAEQKRIVEKCDRLLSTCDEIEKRQQQRQESIVRMNESAIAQLLSSQNPDEFRQHWQRICNNFDLLYSVPETIPKLRQAILQLAVQGKLVRQDFNDEPVSALIERIITQRDKLIANKKINNYKPQPLVEADEITFNLPKGWECIRLGEITDIVSGVTKGRNLTGRQTAYYPYLRVANVQRGFLDLEVMKEIQIPLGKIEKYRLQFGDILLTEGGDWDKLGRSAIWQGQIQDCIHQNHVFRARPLDNGLLSEWAVMYTNSPVGRQYFETAAKRTTNLASINMTQLRYCPFPLPPVEEQKRIVEKCDRLMSLCDTLEAKLKQGRDSSEKLMEVAAKQVLTA